LWGLTSDLQGSAIPGKRLCLSRKGRKKAAIKPHEEKGKDSINLSKGKKKRGIISNKRSPPGYRHYRGKGKQINLSVWKKQEKGNKSSTLRKGKSCSRLRTSRAATLK